MAIKKQDTSRPVRLTQAEMGALIELCRWRNRELGCALNCERPTWTALQKLNVAVDYYKTPARVAKNARRAE